MVFQQIVNYPPTSLKRHRHTKSGHSYDPSAKDKLAFVDKVELPETIMTGPIKATLHFYEKRPKCHYRSGKYSDLLKPKAPKYNISKNDLNVLLGIGGSGPTKRIPAKTFLKVMEEISKEKKCKFFLATGKKEEEQKILNEIKNSSLKNYCQPLDNLSINECLPIIKNCDASICNDTSFSHLSSALGVKTITLMADTPLIYGSYSSKMHPIIPDGETSVSHNTHGKDKINPDKIYEKLLSIIN